MYKHNHPNIGGVNAWIRWLRDRKHKLVLERQFVPGTTTCKQMRTNTTSTIGWFSVYAISLNYLVVFLLIKLSMHYLNTIFLRCFPYHFTCKFKHKCLIFYSIFRAYSKQEQSISSPTTELRVLLPNTKNHCQSRGHERQDLYTSEARGPLTHSHSFSNLLFPIIHPGTKGAQYGTVG
jgi:hypothetical protein